jgi:hypothetical protein
MRVGIWGLTVGTASHVVDSTIQMAEASAIWHSRSLDGGPCALARGRSDALHHNQNGAP